MNRSEWCHVLLAVLCLVTATAVTCPLAPLVSLMVLGAGVGALALYVLVRLRPREDEEGEEP